MLLRSRILDLGRSPPWETWPKNRHFLSWCIQHSRFLTVDRSSPWNSMELDYSLMYAYIYIYMKIDIELHLYCIIYTLIICICRFSSIWWYIYFTHTSSVEFALRSWILVPCLEGVLRAKSACVAQGSSYLWSRGVTHGFTWSWEDLTEDYSMALNSRRYTHMNIL